MLVLKKLSFGESVGKMNQPAIVILLLLVFVGKIEDKFAEFRYLNDRNAHKFAVRIYVYICT